MNMTTTGRRQPGGARGRSGLAVALMAMAVLAAMLVPTSGAPSEAASPPNCGPKVAKSTGGVWKCTWADEFSGSAVDGTKWSPLMTARTGVRTPECRIDSPSNIRVQNGTLRLTVRKEQAPFTCTSPSGDYVTQHTGGGLTTYNKFAQAFGRFEVRAKFPGAKVQGLHSALWMWPQGMRYGDASGEIDIAEFRTNIPERVVPTVHYDDDGTATKKTEWWCYVDRPEDFHTYAVEWTTTTLTFVYDGKVCLSHTWKPAAPLVRPQPFDEPFTVILNQGLGVGYNTLDPAVTPLPATMQVDYVRAWS